jgi:hypothetical protein
MDNLITDNRGVVTCPKCGGTWHRTFGIHVCPICPLRQDKKETPARDNPLCVIKRQALQYDSHIGAIITHDCPVSVLKTDDEECELNCIQCWANALNLSYETVHEFCLDADRKMML